VLVLADGTASQTQQGIRQPPVAAAAELGEKLVRRLLRS